MISNSVFQVEHDKLVTVVFWILRIDVGIENQNSLQIESLPTYILQAVLL